MLKPMVIVATIWPAMRSLLPGQALGFIAREIRLAIGRMMLQGSEA
jgi:hypothetical protein